MVFNENEQNRNISDDELKSEILRISKKKNAVILAHSYQNEEIHPVADFIGDSLELAKKAASTQADIIVFCGVDFMAESAKILSPSKKVLLPSAEANCPMAGMCSAEGLRDLKKQHPDAVVITYINSSAEVKAESDVTCTSANAVKIVEHYKDREIIFTPDKNLGYYCSMMTGADIILWNGHCYVHDEFSTGDIFIAKHEHPDCVTLIHPEAPKEVLEKADFVGSTSQIIKFVEDNLDIMDEKAGVIIGTEIEIAKTLQKRYPLKRIYPLADHAVCLQMKKTTLDKVYNSLVTEQIEIEVEENIRKKALKALNKMLELS
ncbi:MAG: quinolinate synthase NadA [Candidatus Delongbacteria bacterium]